MNNPLLPSPHPDRAVIFATIDDALHFTAEERARVIASYPAYEREARTQGIPSMGSGRIFPITDEEIRVEPFRIPAHWVQINGLDFGVSHPFAATNCAWDRDGDVFYVCKEYRASGQTPITQAAAIKPWGQWIPCAWPSDGLAREKGSAVPLKDQYVKQDLHMLGKHAQFPDGSVGVEAGLMEILDRMQTGRWKVFSTCQGWFGEFRLYHRKDGVVVKLIDDLLSASRYAFMMRRYAMTEPRDDWQDEPRGRDRRTGY
jgi:hypothetical protein